MRAYERLLRYVRFDTTSNSENDSCPSSPGQLTFARALVEEMKNLGIADAHADSHGYVYGTIPANTAGQPVIGLIAHMDTVDDAPAQPMKAHVVENYAGGDVVMDEAGKNWLRVSDYPYLEKCVGKDLIITDGNTLLGADDKAGIAEILTLAEYLSTHPEEKHGDIRIGFTPDEEIGRGADLFDMAGFGADFAYTVDGGALPEIEFENFNAADARVLVHGVSIHPGSAKNMMKNAMLIANEFITLMPPAETPAHTECREGFYHLTDMHGVVEEASLRFIIRDHDRARFEARKAFMRRAADYLNAKYGENTVELTIKDSYYNMLEKLADHMDVVERAQNAMRRAGFTPVCTPIRGGTDGARLSFMGLPCPNLPTGGMNFHGRFEYITVQDMDSAVDILKNIVLAEPTA